MAKSLDEWIKENGLSGMSKEIREHLENFYSKKNVVRQIMHTIREHIAGKKITDD